VIVELAFHTHAVDAIAWNDTKVFTSARLEGTVFGFDLRNPGIPECTITTTRKSSRIVSLSLFRNWLAVGNEEGEAAIVGIENLEEEPVMVGNGATPVVEMDPSVGTIAVASGGHLVVGGEEEDGPDVAFEPRLSQFQILPPVTG
jgi:hypothetical protein